MKEKTKKIVFFSMEAPKVILKSYIKAEKMIQLMRIRDIANMQTISLSLKTKHILMS